MFSFKNKELPDNWKEKAKERRLEIKELKKRVKELSKNRNKWKSKAAKYKDLFCEELKKSPK